MNIISIEVLLEWESKRAKGQEIERENGDAS